MKDGIHLEIVTAGGSVYDDMVSYVELPFSGGSVGVLKDHAPMLGAIEDGVVTENIDLPRAEAAEKRARDRLAERGANLDVKRAQIALHRSLTRQAAVLMMKGR